MGSIPWVNDENAQVERHCEQEVEDFGFSARNELEWLNEHMADVFAKDQMWVKTNQSRRNAKIFQKLCRYS